MDTQEITDYIFLDNEDKRADLALVFGARYIDKPLGVLLPLYPDRVQKIVFSGGINEHTGICEARAMEKRAIELGVSRDDILVEDSSTNTRDNARFSYSLIDERFGLDTITTILGVVKNYHARRALMTLRRWFPSHITLKACPYRVFDFDRNTWSSSLEGEKRVGEEIVKIDKYLRKGDLEEL
jgi:uncharacterized SAM-binding protein YcdF (DUF218 family)